MALEALPDRVAAILGRDEEVARLAEVFQDVQHAFLCRPCSGHAIATERVLMLKEISYLHAGAYPASEFKQGP